MTEQSSLLIEFMSIRENIKQLSILEKGIIGNEAGILRSAVPTGSFWKQQVSDSSHNLSLISRNIKKGILFVTPWCVNPPNNNRLK